MQQLEEHYQSLSSVHVHYWYVWPFGGGSLSLYNCSFVMSNVNAKMSRNIKHLFFPDIKIYFFLIFLDCLDWRLLNGHLPFFQWWKIPTLAEATGNFFFPVMDFLFTLFVFLSQPSHCTGTTGPRGWRPSSMSWSRLQSFAQSPPTLFTKGRQGNSRAMETRRTCCWSPWPNVGVRGLSHASFSNQDLLLHINIQFKPK